MIIGKLITDINLSRKQYGHLNIKPMILGHDTAPLYCVYLHLEGESGKGINRDFFRNENCKGYKLLARSNFKILPVTRKNNRHTTPFDFWVFLLAFKD